MELLDNPIETSPSKAYLIKIAIFYGIVASIVIPVTGYAIASLSEFNGLYRLATLSFDQLSTFNIIKDGLIASYFAFKVTERVNPKNENNHITVLQGISIAFIMSFVRHALLIGFVLFSLNNYHSDSPFNETSYTTYLSQIIMTLTKSFFIQGIIVSIVICVLLHKQIFKNTEGGQP